LLFRYSGIYSFIHALIVGLKIPSPISRGMLATMNTYGLTMSVSIRGGFTVKSGL